MNDIIAALNWRFAVKAFDPSKKVSDADLQTLKAAMRLTPSSLGLQPYHMIVISDSKLREALKPHAYGQSQITESSHLLVFCARTDAMPRKDAMLQIMSGGDPAALAKLKGYEEMVMGSIGGLSEAEVAVWASNQAFIALGTALTTLALLKIDACPMGGFNSAAFDTELALPPYMKSVALLTIGYRLAEPTHPKVRFPESELFSNRA